MRHLDQLPRSDWEYRGIRVTLDDLERIVHILERANLRVEIRDDDAAFDDFADALKHRGAHPSRLAVQGTEMPPHGDPTRQGSLSVNVWFLAGSAHVARMWTATTGDAAREIGELLAATHVRYVGWMGGRERLVGAVGFVILGAAIVRMAVLKEADAGGVFVACVGLLVLAMAAAARWQFFGVWLTRRHEGGIIRRNAEKLAIGALGTALGIAIKAAWDFVAGRL